MVRVIGEGPPPIPPLPPSGESKSPNAIIYQQIQNLYDLLQIPIAQRTPDDLLRIRECMSTIQTIFPSLQKDNPEIAQNFLDFGQEFGLTSSSNQWNLNPTVVLSYKAALAFRYMAGQVLYPHFGSI